MTGNNNTDNDDSNETLISRRAIIATLGAGTAGLGVAAKTGLIELDSDNEDIGPTDPPMNESAADPSTPDPTSVWNRDEVAVSIEAVEDDSGVHRVNGFARGVTREAVTWWNDYITENEPYDLTVTFDENPDNADILFKLNVLGCGLGQYDTPDLDMPTVDGAVCPKTVTEEPSDADLPFTTSVTPVGTGDGAYRLVAQHAIGRYLGYDIWSEPVDVMTPEILVSPSKRLGVNALSLLRAPYGIYTTLETLVRYFPDTLDSLRRSIEDYENDEKAARGEIQNDIEGIRQDLTSWRENREARINQWKRDVEGLSVPHYLEAWEEHVEAEELAYIDETVTLIDDLLDSDEGDLIGSEDLNTFIDRVETMAEWPNGESFDARIHRHYGEAIWSEWENET